MHNIFTYNADGALKALKTFVASAMLVVCLMAVPERAMALSVDHYAASSALSSGKWVRIKVEKQGMQFIGNAELQKMGFSRPDAVNVYGYGGRMLPEALTESLPDDLPMIPVVRTGNGLLFYAVDHTDWTESIYANTIYSHIQNAYSEESWYFLSDREAESRVIEEQDRSARSSDSNSTTFRERLVYDKDLAAPSNTGRVLLGEDFRATPSRTFNFDMPGKATDDVNIIVSFASFASGISSFMVSANGNRLPSTRTDQMEGINSSDLFMRTATSQKKAEVSGDRLTVGLEYTYSGVLSMARLNYIEVEYDRKLSLTGGQLCFYGNFNNSSSLSVEGCTASTQIWDVTDRVNPVKIGFTLDGDKAVFSPGRGLKEFVAFTPGAVAGTVSEYVSVVNQDLHGSEVPNMVIITPEEFLSESERLAAFHRRADGMTVYVVTPQQVYNEFSSGNRDVTAFRKMLKMWYDRDPQKMGYCLLMGRPSYDNKLVTPTVKGAGYPRLPIWQSPTGTSGVTSYSTDDYIGMLEDVEADKMSMAEAVINVAVGRLPVKNQTEAANAVSKLIKYVENPTYGMWRNQVMLIADDQDKGVHLDQAQDVYTLMRGAGNGVDFIYERLYLDSYLLSFTGIGACYPDAKDRMMQKINEGVMFVDYIGHANPRGWGHENLLTWTDINSLTNTNLPIIYAATCEFARWDDDDTSGAEVMVLDPNSGAIAIIAPSRSVYITNNGTLNKSTSRILFERDSTGKGKRLGDIAKEGKNGYPKGDTNKLRYCLVGDPALRLPSPQYNVEVTDIGDISLSGGEMPEIKARQKVMLKGIVKNSEGEKDTDFNGMLEIRLYDAEKVIETNGNGDEGVVSVYNDRNAILVSTATKVNAGEWSVNLMMPAEVSNNYSPALISCYAYDTATGIEANGSTEQLYVYGSEDNVGSDDKGPEIRKYYLNNEYFTEGGVVNSSPVVYARVSDESGINLSDVGIGHKLILILDGDKVYDDVNLCYRPDPDDETSGEFTYPLSDIKPGSHVLTLEVWDNANNSTRADLSFNVGAATDPVIYELTTDCNPASTAVVFSLTTDRPLGKLDCDIEVFDLSGRKVWSMSKQEIADISSTVTAGWDLKDKSGVRVPRGIYLYRATVTTPEGTYSTRTEKLAVTAQ